jgi:hypothetical protein
VHLKSFQPRITSTELKASHLKSTPFQKSKSSSYLSVDRKRSTLRHSFSLGIDRFSFLLHISSCQYTQDFGIAIKDFENSSPHIRAPRLPFAFCIIVILFARRRPPIPIPSSKDPRVTKRKGYDLKTAPLGAHPSFLYLETGKANGLELILLAEFGKPSEPRGDVMMNGRDGARMGYLGAKGPCQIFTIVKIMTAWSSQNRILDNQVHRPFGRTFFSFAVFVTS